MTRYTARHFLVSNENFSCEMKSFLTLENISARNMSQEYSGLTGKRTADFCAGEICGLPVASATQAGLPAGRHGMQSGNKSLSRSIRKFRATHGLPAGRHGMPNVHKDRTDENHRHA